MRKCQVNIDSWEYLIILDSWNFPRNLGYDLERNNQLQPKLEMHMKLVVLIDQSIMPKCDKYLEIRIYKEKIVALDIYINTRLNFLIRQKNCAKIAYLYIKSRCEIQSYLKNLNESIILYRDEISEVIFFF